MNQLNIHKKLREVGGNVFNGGHIQLKFGQGYEDELSVEWYCGKPEAAHELIEFMKTWKAKHFPDIKSTARPSVDDDIPF